MVFNWGTGDMSLGKYKTSNDDFSSKLAASDVHDCCNMEGLLLREELLKYSPRLPRNSLVGFLYRKE